MSFSSLMERYVELLLRVGLAFAFLYPPVSAFLDPFAWIGFFPEFVRDIFGNDTILLHVFGAIEVVLGVWILVGRNVFWPALIMAVMLGGIVVFNWGAIEILFRDISILAMALALVVMHRPKPRTLTV